MSNGINHNRRHFLGTAAMTIAAAQLDMIGSAIPQSRKTEPPHLPTIKTGTDTSFGPVKQIDAGLLNVGYAEDGPANGPAVILLHGWPYDIHSYVDVAPLLAAKGYQVIVPYRLWHDALSVKRNGTEWPAVGGRCRHHRLDGRSQDREGDHGRV